MAVVIRDLNETGRVRPTPSGSLSWAKTSRAQPAVRRGEDHPPRRFREVARTRSIFPPKSNRGRGRRLPLGRPDAAPGADRRGRATYDAVVLAYGLCGGATAGLRADPIPSSRHEPTTASRSSSGRPIHSSDPRLRPASNQIERVDRRGTKTPAANGGGAYHTVSVQQSASAATRSRAARIEPRMLLAPRERENVANAFRPNKTQGACNEMRCATGPLASRSVGPWRRARRSAFREPSAGANSRRDQEMDHG